MAKAGTWPWTRTRSGPSLWWRGRMWCRRRRHTLIMHLLRFRRQLCYELRALMMASDSAFGVRWLYKMDTNSHKHSFVGTSANICAGLPCSIIRPGVPSLQPLLGAWLRLSSSCCLGSWLHLDDLRPLLVHTVLCLLYLTF